MYIDYGYETIPITKEEYEKNKYKCKNDSWIEKLIELQDNYFKVPIWNGIQSIIDDKPEGYKYYKRGKFQAYIICGAKEYDTVTKIINKYYKSIN